MIGVVVVVCGAFGLTVSEAKTEIMCLHTKEMSEATAIFSVEAAGQVYNQTNEFIYLRGDENHNAALSIAINSAYAAYGAASGRTPSSVTTGRVLPLNSNSVCQDPRYLRQCCTAASRGDRARANTTGCAEPTTAS